MTSCIYAKITEDDNGDETYADPLALAKAMTAELSVELAEATLYADDGAAEVGEGVPERDADAGCGRHRANAVAEDLTGAVIDENGVLISASEDGGAPVAIGFRAKKANGKYRYFWLYRVIFGIPATNLTTKGESIEFSTPSIEGTVTRTQQGGRSGQTPLESGGVRG
ncbi:MAG: major tail protein [Coprococcus sp.]